MTSFSRTMMFLMTSPSSRRILLPTTRARCIWRSFSMMPGMAQSAGEARRLIDGGGVKVNGEQVAAREYNLDPALSRERRSRWGSASS